MVSTPFRKDVREKDALKTIGDAAEKSRATLEKNRKMPPFSAFPHPVHAPPALFHGKAAQPDAVPGRNFILFSFFLNYVLIASVSV
jgi:hypothetical protein